MYYGLEAMVHGGVAGLVAFPPALLLFWWLTLPLNAGHPVLRPIIAIFAALGLAQFLSNLWALVFERIGFEDEAIAGALIVIAGLALLAFPLLLLLRWWQRRATNHSSSET